MNRFLQSFVNLLSLGRAQREEFTYPDQELLFIIRSGSSPSDSTLTRLSKFPLFTQVKPLQRTLYSDVMAMPPETWSSHCLYFNSSAQIQAWLSELPPTKGSQPLYLELNSSWDLIKLRKLPWDISHGDINPRLWAWSCCTNATPWRPISAGSTKAQPLPSIPPLSRVRATQNHPCASSPNH